MKDDKQPTFCLDLKRSILGVLSCGSATCRRAFLPNHLSPRLSIHRAPRFFTMSESYTTADIAKHKDEASRMWIIVDTGVYDITGRSS